MKSEAACMLFRKYFQNHQLKNTKCVARVALSHQFHA